MILALRQYTFLLDEFLLKNLHNIYHPAVRIIDFSFFNLPKSHWAFKIVKIIIIQDKYTTPHMSEILLF